MDKIRHSFGDALRKRPLLFRGPLCFFPLLMIFFAACSGGGGGGSYLSFDPNANKAITHFGLENQYGPAYVTRCGINNTSLTVTAGISFDTGADMTNLVPVIVHSGVDIVPASGTAQDFTSPVTYTITAEDGSQAVWTVNVKKAVLNVADLSGYLTQGSVSQTGSASDPIPLPVSLNLADTSGNGWTDLLDAINTEDEYVALDLSASTMSGTEFDPGIVSAGENKIVSLVLPDEATSIKSGVGYPTYNGLMEDFSALESVSGAGIETIGANAFTQCTALKTVDFPAVKTIGANAFYMCSGLTELSLPASLSSIGANPFNGCKNLTSITVDPGNPYFKHSADNKALLSKDGKTLYSYPSAAGDLSVDATVVATLAGITHVGFSALSNTLITAVNLPAAVSIGEQAFNGCTSLQTVSLPAAESIGNAAFSWTGGIPLTVILGSTPPALGTNMFYASPLLTKTVKVKVPSGAVGYGSSPVNISDNNWGNAFRGKGWDSTNGYGSSGANGNISLTIEELP